ncbi:hypothetical protein MSP8887_00254 [Marinomonas spartinae]|uniref:Uncharacterized protein n=1 Tax=Marinomonas spartinae TaxID=1792290 RepID=A0A1A8THV8_9GAMM|nr:hypothetical protein [Marinomonas spartinae]SBS25749.1 hypothetical protein MSP8887_00254 [Marinomonas spartinae]SBS32304.1 hypothetical protein MSP8886_02384 [Marinomonas spartinae]
MKILSDKEFLLKLMSESTDTEPPKSQIWVNGKAVDSFIEGEVCEACIGYENFYLVFTTNNSPFEESLNIQFLDQNCRLLDQATLVWPYSTGSFTLIGLTEPNFIAFKFFEETVWEIALYPSKKLVIPYFSEPAGVWRKFRLRHYFKISKKSVA